VFATSLLVFSPFYISCHCFMVRVHVGLTSSPPLSLAEAYLGTFDALFFLPLGLWTNNTYYISKEAARHLLISGSLAMILQANGSQVRVHFPMLVI
jgi:hypothetical protein